MGLTVYTVSRYSHVRPLVIRIDEGRTGGSGAVRRGHYQPQPPELRYFLTQFIVKHFSRLRATVQRDYRDLQLGSRDAVLSDLHTDDRP